MTSIEESFVDIPPQNDADASDSDNASTPYQWSYYNGRRYASNSLGHYYMPNDEPEIQRLNEQHSRLTQIKRNSLHFAPLPSDRPIRILDIGCGSGIWCLEMSEKYPDAKIMGMDVSPIQPSKNKPDNVRWIVQDMEAEWSFAEGEECFDLIHLSLIHGCVADWEKFMQKIVRYLVPRGWVEHQEFSLCRQYIVDEHGQEIDLGEDIEKLPAVLKWGRLMEQAANKRGRQLQLGPHLKIFQERAGLQNVEEKVFAHRYGTWMEDPEEKELGRSTMLNTLEGLQGFTTAMFTKSLGWSLEETKGFIGEVERDLRDDGLRKVIDLHVVCGQKASGGVEKAGGARKMNRDTIVSSKIATGLLIGGAIASLLALWRLRRR